MKEVLLRLLIQELVNPVVLALDVRRELLLQENERVHLPEKLLASGVITLLPEVFALNFELKFLSFNLPLILLLINFACIIFATELFDDIFGRFNLCLSCMVLGVVLDFDEFSLKLLP